MAKGGIIQPTRNDVEDAVELSRAGNLPNATLRMLPKKIPYQYIAMDDCAVSS